MIYLSLNTQVKFSRNISAPGHIGVPGDRVAAGSISSCRKKHRAHGTRSGGAKHAKPGGLCNQTTVNPQTPILKYCFHWHLHVTVVS